MTLSIITGNIGCGKSELAKKLAKLGNVVVSMDNIQSSMAGGEYGLYDYNKKDIYLSVEDTMIESSLKAGLSVVIDRTNMDIKRRKRFIDIGEKYTKNIISYDFGTGNQDELLRRINNPRGISEHEWSKVWQLMKKSYEEPTENEGFTNIVKMPLKYKFHAFDFDGTIVSNSFPEIGIVLNGTVSKINKLYEDISNIIIIWGCRSGDYENQMRSFLLKNKIPFDYINENPFFDVGRKVFAHEYHDDRNA